MDFLLYNGTWVLETYLTVLNLLDVNGFSEGNTIFVMPRLGGRTRGNCRVFLSGPQFLRTPLKNPQGMHWNQNPFEKRITKPR